MHEMYKWGISPTFAPSFFVFFYLIAIKGYIITEREISIGISREMEETKNGRNNDVDYAPAFKNDLFCHCRVHP